MKNHTKRRYIASGANPFERIIRLIGRNYNEFVKNLATLFPENGQKVAQAIGNGKQDQLYRQFHVKKKRGKRGAQPKLRLIYSPCDELKLMQEDMDGIIRCQYFPNPNSHGFEPSKSTRTAAEQLRKIPNLAEKETTNIDIKGAFPAISGRAIRSLLRHKTTGSFQLTPWQINVLAKILTSSNDKLATGSPASPAVFNWRLTSLDAEMEKMAKSRKWNYIRYADDLTITHYRTQKKEVIERTIAMLKGYDLTIAREKLKTYHKGVISILGLLVSKTIDTAVELPRRVRRTFRAILWKLGRKECSQNRFMVHDAFKIIAGVDQERRWKQGTLEAQACGFSAYVIHAKQVNRKILAL